MEEKALAFNQNIIPATNPNAKEDRKSIPEERDRDRDRDKDRDRDRDIERRRRRRRKRERRIEEEERKENKGRRVVIHMEQVEMTPDMRRSQANQEVKSCKH